MVSAVDFGSMYVSRAAALQRQHFARRDLFTFMTCNRRINMFGGLLLLKSRGRDNRRRIYRVLVHCDI